MPKNYEQVSQTCLITQRGWVNTKISCEQTSNQTLFRMITNGAQRGFENVRWLENMVSIFLYETTDAAYLILSCSVLVLFFGSIPEKIGHLSNLPFSVDRKIGMDTEYCWKRKVTGWYWMVPSKSRIISWISWEDFICFCHISCDDNSFLYISFRFLSFYLLKWHPTGKLIHECVIWRFENFTRTKPLT